MRWVNIQ